MLRLTHFFDGTMRKEEVASAFLAMALEDLPSFRAHFFSCVPPLTSIAASSPVIVKVEEQRVDVRIEVGDYVVLVENKVRQGSLQTGQMLKYYKREVEQHPERRVICVFLAPREVGRREVQQVLENPDFRGTDAAVHLAWESLFSYRADEADLFGQFVKGGLDRVSSVIQEARLAGPYGRVGERGEIRSLVDHALVQLAKECPLVGFHRWSEKDIEMIRTKHTIVTVYIDAHFKSGPEPHFAPQDTRDAAGRFRLTLRSEIKLAEGIRKRSAAAQWWDAQLKRREFNVEGVGQFALDDVDGRLRWEGVRVLNQGEMTAEMVRVGKAVVTAVTAALSTRGLSLSKVEDAATL